MLVMLAIVLTFSMVIPQVSFANSSDSQSSKSSNRAYVDEKVISEFDKEEFVKVLVVLEQQTNTEKVAQTAVNNAMNQKNTVDSLNLKSVKQHAVVNSLQQTAEHSQKNLITFLSSEKKSGKVKEFESFFIFNGLAVTGTKESIEKIADFSEVKSIILDEKQTIQPVTDENLNPTDEKASTSSDDIEWNISRIGAPEVWGRGITGEGIVVANIDSGVIATHPALKAKYRGYDPNNPDVLSHEFNWFDGVFGYAAPNDSDGHGTHTMGTMVGQEPDNSNQIGVAPGAKWIAARAFWLGESHDSYIIRSAQWMLAPTDRNGVPHPEKAPDVINNSWGGNPLNNDWFRPLVQAWRSAGIVPIFSTGNAGLFITADPGSASAPGNYPESIAVGATTSTDELASFSLRGPSENGDVKPDLVAPGVGIRSSLPGETWNTFSYGTMNGTSMAAPQVAGTIALMKQVDETLTVDQIEDILKLTTVQKTDDAYPEFPNNGYGYGLLNADAAVAAVETGIGSVHGQVVTNGTDNEAPSYNQESRKVVYEGMDTQFSIQAEDNKSVNKVLLHARINETTAKSYETSLEQGNHQNGTFSANIPGDDLEGTSIEYWWTIEDFYGNKTETEHTTIPISQGITNGYIENFESYPDGWSSFGVQNSWEWGKPVFGPKGASSGEKVYGTNLRGQTEMFANMTLMMPPILVEDNSVLSFKQWYSIARWDTASVYASEDGVNWEQLYQFNQANKFWHDIGLDLSKFNGKKIFIAFNLQTDDARTDGWYIDDVRLTSGDTQDGMSIKDSKITKLPFSDRSYPVTELLNQNSVMSGELPVESTVKVVETGWSTKTNSHNGAFEIHHPAGTYTLEITAYGFETTTQIVTLTPQGKVTPSINLQAKPIQKIKGKIKDALGQPVKDATILLLEDGNAQPVKSGEDGSFSLNGYEGTYTLKVFAKGHHSKTQSIEVKRGENIAYNVKLPAFESEQGAEIHYDNGKYNKNIAFGKKGNGFAVKMSLTEGQNSAMLTGAKLQFWAAHVPVPGGDDIVLTVYDAKGKNGEPGNILAGPIHAKAQRNLSKWTEVDLSNLGIVVEEDFYILYSQADDYPYVPGFVTDGDKNNWAARSWDYIGGQWFKSNQSLGNYMIRAVVDYGTEAQSVQAEVALKNEEMVGAAPFDVGFDVFVGSEDLESVDYQISTNPVSDEEGIWENTEVQAIGGEFIVTLRETGDTYIHVKVKDLSGQEVLETFGPFTVEDEPLPIFTELKVDPSVVDLIEGGTSQLSVKSITTQGDKVTEEDVTNLADYSGYDPAVISVSDGLVTAIGKGETDITIKYGDDTATVKVNVQKAEGEPDIELVVSTSSLQLKEGDSNQLTVKVITRKGDEIEEKDVTNLATYSGFDSEIITVDNGLVQAVGKGETTIIASYEDLEAIVEVTVTDSQVDPTPTGTLKVLPDNVSLTLGSFKQLVVMLMTKGEDGTETETNVTSKTVYTGFDENIIVVTEKGFVLAIGEGKTKITATYDGKTVTVDVQVNKADPIYPPYIPPVFPNPEQPTPIAPSFTDIANTFAKDEINKLAAKGIFQGKTETTFSPNADISRAEFAVVLARALDLPMKDFEGTFFDVPTSKKWAYAGVEAAARAGIVNGTENGEFNPDAPITREEIATMVIRAIDYKNKSLLKDLKMPANFNDHSTIGAFAIESVYQAAALGVILGDKGKFYPKNNATRAEAAVMLYRSLLLLEKID